MFSNPPRPLGCANRNTPCFFEKEAGRLPRPPKSPLLATRTQRSTRSWSVRGDGYAIFRDDLTKGIPMYTPENEAARPELARAADEAIEAGNLEGNDTKPASKLFAEADAIAASIPYVMTRERKRATLSCLFGVWLSALAASRERAV